MKKNGILKYSIILSLLIYSSLLNAQSDAKILSMQDLEDLPSAEYKKSDPSKAFDSRHWAYKTLENISKKYGLMYGKPGEKFDANKPLTRNEAAVLLVNLVGKIEQDKIQITDIEKGKIEILRQELDQEMQALIGRVSNLETSVETLKGTVSNLEESDKRNWKYDFGENLKINGDLQLQYTGNIKKDSQNYPSNFSVPYSEVYISGKLNKNLDFLVNISPTNFFDNSSLNGVLYDAYVSTNIIPHHTIMLGQTQVPIGQEGPQSILTKETIDKSQFARNYADTYDLGVKIVGNWEPIDYYLGAYNGNGMNKTDTNNALSWASWVNVRPFYKVKPLKSFEIGSGYYAGNTGDFARDIFGFYGSYKLGNYGIRGEFSRINGYEIQDQIAQGWSILNTYNLSKKLQLVAKFDTFDPDRAVEENTVQEYTLGGNYLLNDYLMFRLNMIYVNNKQGPDAQRIGIMTQCMF